jgi:predicted nuclease of restriction endonuclease-like (RecB) superfamily
MKSFYETYFSSEKLAPLVREIAWSHNLVILERCTDPLQREFYVRMTKKFGWTKSVLIHQIENQSLPAEASWRRQTTHGSDNCLCVAFLT